MGGRTNKKGAPDESVAPFHDRTDRRSRFFYFNTRRDREALPEHPSSSLVCLQSLPQ
jgi:hypothetical protein